MLHGHVVGHHDAEHAALAQEDRVARKHSARRLGHRALRDELAARVNAQLNIGKAVESVLEYGDIILDYKASKIRCKAGNEDVGINNKEFQLLEYLMSNSDRILSREMIYDRVWGMDSEAVSNNLEAYMSFVRKKLKVIGSKVTIKTVRNMGYKLEYEDK